MNFKIKRTTYGLISLVKGVRRQPQQVQPLFLKNSKFQHAITTSIIGSLSVMAVMLCFLLSCFLCLFMFLLFCFSSSLFRKLGERHCFWVLYKEAVMILGWGFWWRENILIAICSIWIWYSWLLVRFCLIWFWRLCLYCFDVPFLPLFNC